MGKEKLQCKIVLVQQWPIHTVVIGKGALNVHENNGDPLFDKLTWWRLEVLNSVAAAAMH